MKDKAVKTRNERILEDAASSRKQFYETHAEVMKDLASTRSGVPDRASGDRGTLDRIRTGVDAFDALPADVVKMCKFRGWSMHWTHRGAYLHLESSELIEAIRGKHGDPMKEAADVLLVLMSITEYAEIPWLSVLRQARTKCDELMTKPRYPGEEYERATSPSGGHALQTASGQIDDNALVIPDFLRHRRSTDYYGAVAVPPNAGRMREVLAELPGLIVRSVAELPDRNSPEDWPEAMIVTDAELDRIVRRHIDELLGEETHGPR